MTHFAIQNRLEKKFQRDDEVFVNTDGTIMILLVKSLQKVSLGVDNIFVHNLNVSIVYTSGYKICRDKTLGCFSRCVSCQSLIMGKTQSKRKLINKKAERRCCITKAEREGWRSINAKKKTYTLVQDTWEHVPATLGF